MCNKVGDNGGNNSEMWPRINKNPRFLDFPSFVFLINHCDRHQDVQNEFFQSWQIFGYRKRWFLQKSLLEEEMQRLLTFCSTEFYPTAHNCICIGVIFNQSLHVTSLCLVSLLYFVFYILYFIYIIVFYIYIFNQSLHVTSLCLVSLRH